MKNNQFEVALENSSSVSNTLDILLVNLEILCESSVDTNGIKYGVYQEGNFIEHKTEIHRRIPSYSELAFFLSAVKDTNNSDKILTYIQLIKQKNKVKKVWLDDEMPMGLNASFALANNEKKYITAFIELLRTCDMNHEVYQHFFIELVLNKWGICDETLALLAARSGSISGQWALEGFDIPTLLKEQKKCFLEYLLQDSFESKHIFPNNLINAFKIVEISVDNEEFIKLFDRGKPMFDKTNIQNIIEKMSL